MTSRSRDVNNYGEVMTFDPSLLVTDIQMFLINIQIGYIYLI
jgi:hypothetical protein